MDSEGYPEQKELNKIKKWDNHDFLGLISFIEGRWAYNCISKEIIKDFRKSPIIEWRLATAGWSGNESIINALLDNQLFRMMWYYQWTRGGKYIFRIDPTNVGFKLVSQFCKENKVTRQAIHKQKEKFEWISITPYKNFIRPISYIKRKPKEELSQAPQ